MMASLKAPGLQGMCSRRLKDDWLTTADYSRSYV